jgi:outer membrane protein assembly factor BamB
VPPANCTIHAVGDPTVAEWNGRQAVLVATTENALFDLDPVTGDVRDRYELSSYGYTSPQVVDLVSGGDDELLIVDARGTVQVIGTNGSVVWRQALGAYVWAHPIVWERADDGATRLALGTSDGRLFVWAADGSPVRAIEAPFDGAITWTTSGQLDDDPAPELVAATTKGQVVAVDGATGTVEWTRSFGSFAAVRAIGDAEADGANEVYATAADGVVRSLEGDTGRTLWEREVATTDVQMMPPPILGDVTGDAVEELVVASNDGRVFALDPAAGTLIADYDRDEAVFETPTLGDVDGDDQLEVFVIYASGHVVRLDFEA